MINILEYIERSAQTYPDKPAFVDEQGSLTFGEVLQIARAVGSRLVRTVAPGNPVVVLMEKSRFTPTCLLGAVYSGGFYVPLDVQLPAQRISQILHTVEPSAILADAAGAAALRGLDCQGALIPATEAMACAADESALKQVRAQAADTQPLYAMFTSGSTGIPKGVLVSHRSVIDFIEQFTSTFAITSDDTLGNQAPFDFDISVKDIYTCLRCCATLCIIPRRFFSFPGELFAWLNQQHVTTLIWAVSALRIAAVLKAFDAATPHHLKRVLFSGEVMPLAHLRTWMAHLPDVQYVNLYGPTEITCNCTYYIVGRELPAQGSLPIGRPFRNTRILVLNDANEPVAEDEVGEICVLGAGLALGYYNAPEQTARAFIQNPLNPHYPERMYRTGDLGRYNAEGELLFLGRRDGQIKHMGHRIELGDIEAAAGALEGIHSCCCLYNAAAQQIYLLHESEGLSERDILLALRERLPRYMLPHKVVAVAHMPLNKNGKIDRARLIAEYIDGQRA